MSFKELYDLGYKAASHGEKRAWCEDYGIACLMGWNAYWEEHELGLE